jgi:hypothetical protein
MEFKKTYSLNRVTYQSKGTFIIERSTNGCIDIWTSLCSFDVNALQHSHNASALGYTFGIS